MESGGLDEQFLFWIIARREFAPRGARKSSVCAHSGWIWRGQLSRGIRYGSRAIGAPRGVPASLAAMAPTNFACFRLKVASALPCSLPTPAELEQPLPPSRPRLRGCPILQYWCDRFVESMYEYLLINVQVFISFKGLMALAWGPSINVLKTTHT